MNIYDIIIVGAGASGVFTAYEAIKNNPKLKILVIEKGDQLEKRKCPIDGEKIPKCINCKTCSIMNGFGGAGAKLYSTNNSKIKSLALRNDLH